MIINFVSQIPAVAMAVREPVMKYGGGIRLVCGWVNKYLSAMLRVPRNLIYQQFRRIITQS